MAEVWPFQPELGNLETLTTLTEVLGSRTGEQRLELRQAARQKHSYTHILDYREFMQFTQLARRNAALDMLVPIWVECIELEYTVEAADDTIAVDTTFSDFRVGGQALLWVDETESVAVTIESMTDDELTLTVPVGSQLHRPIVMPLRTGFPLEGFKVTRDTTFVTVTVDFQMQDNVKHVLDTPIYIQYLGADVMTDRPVMIDSINESVIRAAEYCDNGFGAVSIETVKNYVDMGRTVSFRETRGRELWERRCWLGGLNGKQKTFWMPTFNHDLIITEISDGTAITVETVAPTGYYALKHILIVLSDGNMYPVQISAATVVDPTHDELTFVTPVGVPIDPEDVYFICFLGLSRLDTDEISIRHDQGDSSSMTIPIVEVPA